MSNNSELEQFAEKLAGNWKKFNSFGWHNKPDNAEDYAIVYLNNRDSTLLEESNAHSIREELKPFLEADEPDIHEERHSHWACGWVDSLVIRVYKENEDGDKTITDAFKAYFKLRQQLENHPVLDDDDYSRREYEATIKNITSEGYSLVRDDAPDEWAYEVYTWLWNNNQDAVENKDDFGGYPSKENIIEALKALDLFDEDNE